MAVNSPAPRTGVKFVRAGIEEKEKNRSRGAGIIIPRLAKEKGRKRGGKVIFFFRRRCRPNGATKGASVLAPRR